MKWERFWQNRKEEAGREKGDVKYWKQAKRDSERNGTIIVEKRGVSRRGKNKKIIDWKPDNYKTQDCTLILLRNKRKGRKTKRNKNEK